MGVVGFFSFDDFCSELAEYGHPDYPVRVQWWFQARAAQNVPITHYNYLLEAAHENPERGEVFVCRFNVGSTSVMGDLTQERERLVKLEKRAEKLYETLINNLRRSMAGKFPVKIRPGAIAAAADAKTEASIDSLINSTHSQEENSHEKAAVKRHPYLSGTDARHGSQRPGGLRQLHRQQSGPDR